MPTTPKTAPVSAPPAIGQPWPEQGGIYAGISRGDGDTPDGHLIIATLPFQKHTWAAAMQAAAELNHADRQDWRVPTRNESALLYANVREQIETGDLYWTSTPSGTARAWFQFFHDGTQLHYDVSCDARVRFVRRVL